MENQRRVACPENEELASFMWSKRQEMAEPKGLSERVDSTLYKAYCNLCNTKTPIKTLKEFSEIKGIGKWTLRLMQEFFKKSTDCDSPVEQLSPKDKKKTKGTKRYLLQRSSVAYALLITLYRGTANGNDFMRKQELIDAAEASGLSRAPIAPEAGKGKSKFGSSPREWYSGWSCMKTLVTKGLVAKSSCPAKYMLTQEGLEAARECLSRSGLADPKENLDATGNFPSNDDQSASDSEMYCPLAGELELQSVKPSNQEKSLDVPIKLPEKAQHNRKSRGNFAMYFEVLATSKMIVEERSHVRYVGYAIGHFKKDCWGKTSPKEERDASIWTSYHSYHMQHVYIANMAVLCHSELSLVLCKSVKKDCLQTSGKDFNAMSNAYNVKNVGRAGPFVEESSTICRGARQAPDILTSTDSGQSSFSLKACSSTDYAMLKSSNHDAGLTNINVLMVPPLRHGEGFEDVYDVVLVLDDREQFVKKNKGCRSRKIIEAIRNEFKIQIEVRRLPVGDALWIARNKQLEDEYVLDFIVERKEVDDLSGSITDNRYKEQKLKMLRCGLQKLIYVVEGDPNVSEAAERIKTACFTTEILEGFDVLRTSGLGDTMRKYAHLTRAITHHCTASLSNYKGDNKKSCPSFDAFLKKCEDLEKMTVSDVFGIQLMQVPQVTEDIAVAVMGLYPTLISLARAYSLHDGDIQSQEEMLMKQTNKLVTKAASKNIFKLVWGT